MLINATKNQSILDIAIQTYGSASALAKMVADNVRGNFEFSSGLIPGKSYAYDIENGLANKRILKRLNGQYVMRYKTGIINTNIITEDGFDLVTEDGQLFVKE